MELFRMMGNFIGLRLCIFVPHGRVFFAIALSPLGKINFTKTSYTIEEFLAVAHTFFGSLVCDSIIKRQRLLAGGLTVRRRAQLSQNKNKRTRQKLTDSHTALCASGSALPIISQYGIGRW